MPDPSIDKLAIYIPAALRTANEPEVMQLGIIADAKLRGGKRALTRQYRDSNTSDPSRLRRVEWQVGGLPVGASVESTAGGLAIDFTQGLETRWPRRLTSQLAFTNVTLTGTDPAYGGTTFGVTKFGGGAFGAAVGGANVVVFSEQAGYLFVGRGAVDTQVNYSTWIPVAAHVLDADIRDAEHWYGYGWLALGPTAPMAKRVGVGSSGATYEDTVSTTPAGNVYASHLTRGSDRAWYIDAGVTYDNFAGYTLDAFENLASPFQVGDPRSAVNGMGTFGPVTDFGSVDNIYSFTDQGKPVPLSKALDTIHSTQNGSQFADPGWGWHYYIAVNGLRARSIGGVDNPVGVGERMRDFTGHSGVPTAIWAARGELWVVYRTPSGEAYAYRGTFGPETAGTGQPQLYPWFYESSLVCNALFASTTPNAGTQNLTMIRARGTNMSYQTIAANGRDDLASNPYSTGGGVAYLTTLDRDANLLKTFRLARVRTRNMTSGSSWQLAVAFNPDPTGTTAATYVNIGSAITANGAQTIIPVSGTTPTSSISGRTFKPRWTQVAGGSGAASTPPTLEGTMEVEYDERPDTVEEIEVVISMTAVGYSNNRVWDILNALVSQQSDGPFRVQLPDDLPSAVAAAAGGGTKYVMVTGVAPRQDLTDDTEAVTVRMVTWPQGVAL